MHTYIRSAHLDRPPKRVPGMPCRNHPVALFRRFDSPVDLLWPNDHGIADYSDMQLPEHIRTADSLELFTWNDQRTKEDAAMVTGAGCELCICHHRPTSSEWFLGQNK